MKNFIFVFILFSLLLAVNAVPFQNNKRAITFEACDFDDHDPVDLLTVKIGTGPQESGKSESFDVSGTLTKNDIFKGQASLEISYADSNGELLDGIYIQVFNDSFRAGTPFKISAPDVSTPKLPDSYFISVLVIDPSPTTLLACASATVGVGM